MTPRPKIFTLCILSSVLASCSAMDSASLNLAGSTSYSGRAITAQVSPMEAPLDQALNSAINRESYNKIIENAFVETQSEAKSTFSIDVDTASYTNIRRFIEQNKQLPPADAVRIEEMINYFPYRYALPEDNTPFSVHTALAECPWTPNHQLMKIGIKGQPVSTENTPASNFVFLLDVSGSMNNPNKLPLLKRSLKLLVDQMREKDHVSIVVYAGAAGVVLPPTNGSQREKILAALDELSAGGSTAGSAGIEKAYELAKMHFREGGNNRVILATDGDFNVGPSSESELIRLIESKRNQGIFLTVMGFGQGNLQDSKMEQLANKGNGSYYYIDSALEAKKVLVSEMGGSMLTIAKDVKLQLEFDPKQVASYRLIGYENRVLNNEDFDNDAKDAGELGAGTTVTALYEIVPQTTVNTEAPLAQLNLRYKAPNADQSQLIQHGVSAQPLSWRTVPEDFRFAAAVANFGMQLRGSQFKGQWSYADIISEAQKGIGRDTEGYRQGFVKLVQQAQSLK